MKGFIGGCILSLSLMGGMARAQISRVEPWVTTKSETEGKVTVVDVAPRFVTTIRLPDTVSSVVVGDPSDFQVEHSDREPKLVFVKAISKSPVQTNLLISTTTGRQVSLLLVSRGDAAPDRGTIDFLVKYEVSSDFFVSASGFPFALVGATVPLSQDSAASSMGSQTNANSSIRASASNAQPDSPANADRAPINDATSLNLDNLLGEQEASPLPAMYGEHTQEESTKGDHVRAGVSRVIDEGDRAVVLFSVMNPTKHAILVMPPQIQLGGQAVTGKLVKHQKWTTAEQLPVEDFRLNRRRLGLGERADGVVVFVRPPYKQSNETLLLQVAESGAVDRPALAPIGFGVSTALEEEHGGRR